MSWITNIFTKGASSFASTVADVADRFIETPDEKTAFKLQVEQLVADRDSETEQTLRAELGAKERVLVAELKQGDTYTKRARPTVVYSGLAFIGINYVLFPLLGRILNGFGLDIDTSPLADLPLEFWGAWGGICATWSIGRSMEKRGANNPVVRSITGSNQSRLID
ncbi:hypothetical protein TW85_24700 [Marinomonas sp. S3726]|uniref:3TM-type holin n=1 Tax=Marinomonas sp. S3726 TaxID=579484 RepID=UPI0005F9B7BD|nr:3TM-type holin [Marinomonas sp. S3726]KJZ07799.1 hypothetical protein TW85_24700 [Marinomonas sp. S3726]